MQYLEEVPTDSEHRSEVVQRLFGPQVQPVHQPADEESETRDPTSLVIGMTMREAYESLRKQAIPFRFQGSGVALMQEPRMGFNEKEADGVVQVQFFSPPRLDVN